MKRPAPDEAAEALFAYINRVPEGDINRILETQHHAVVDLFNTISEEDSLYHYAPGKWSIRQVLSHINDSERLFAFRAFWFARGFDSPLPGFEQDVAADGAAADGRSLQSHIGEFRSVRQATLSFVQSLSPEIWDRSGVAGGSPVTVRALIYLAAGHVDHHVKIFEERYRRK